jgi:hypothetical protein
MMMMMMMITGFRSFFKHHSKILVGNSHAKLGKEDIFKPTIGNGRLHLDINDSGVRIVNFATSKNLAALITMFPHGNIYKYAWISPDGNTHNQIDHLLIH